MLLNHRLGLVKFRFQLANSKIYPYFEIQMLCSVGNRSGKQIKERLNALLEDEFLDSLISIYNP